MDSFESNPLWGDINLPPSLPALADDEFIALLQKQFGANSDYSTVPAVDTAKLATNAPITTNINPQSLTRLSTVRPAPITPPSEDSSPSPPSTTEPPSSRSRRQSELYQNERDRNSDDDTGDDSTLKRKASEDSDDDEPTHKSQHTSSISKKNSTSSRRKSTGNPTADENRLLKRKEQNRAAQRAFRERKEKHVKDLEDKVAALEEKNAVAQAENDNLREVVSRLQNENVRLRQTPFTFNVPSSSSSSMNQNAGPSREQKRDQPIPLFNSPQTASTSSSVSTTDSPQSLFADKSDDPLAFLNNPALTVIGSETTATSEAMNLDFGFHPLNNTPYTTIASNPLFMSFREPDPLDGINQIPQPNVFSPPIDISNSNANNQNYFTGWPDINMEGLNGLQAFDLTNSLDELFGGSGFSSSGSDFYNPTPNSVSPVSHRKSPGDGGSSNSSGSSPSMAMQSTPNLGSNSDSCSMKKCTKEVLANALAQDPGSMFAPRQSPNQSIFTPSPSESSSMPETPALGSTVGSKMDAAKEFPPCKGLQLPKTLRDEKNVEVMSAWKAIRHDPNFQDVDINQLCTEFASKARCDGSQVVIEPNGMQEILDSVTKSKRAKQQEQLFSASQNLARLGNVLSAPK